MNEWPWSSRHTQEKGGRGNGKAVSKNCPVKLSTLGLTLLHKTKESEKERESKREREREREKVQTLHDSPIACFSVIHQHFIWTSVLEISFDIRKWTFYPKKLHVDLVEKKTGEKKCWWNPGQFSKYKIGLAGLKFKKREKEPSRRSNVQYGPLFYQLKFQWEEREKEGGGYKRGRRGWGGEGARPIEILDRTGWSCHEPVFMFHVLTQSELGS